MLGTTLWQWGLLGDITQKTFLLFFFVDYVYFETSSSTPYQIRRIEELNKVRNISCSSIALLFSQLLRGEVGQNAGSRGLIKHSGFESCYQSTWQLDTGCRTSSLRPLSTFYVLFTDTNWKCWSKSHVLLQEAGHLGVSYSTGRQTSKWVTPLASEWCWGVQHT